MLPLDDFRPLKSRYNRPIPVPFTDPGDTPGSSVTLSCEWWSYVIGCCKHMLDQGAWNTNDQTEMSDAIARVYDLLEILTAASDTGDCATVDLACDYDFSSAAENPWVTSPTPDTLFQSAWSGIFGAWVGSNSTDEPEVWAEVAIQADYIPFTVDAMSITYGGAPDPCCGETWAIRFYDHDLNLLQEVADTGGSTVGFAGPLAHVCRIIVHRRANSEEGLLQPTITDIAMTGRGVPGGCEQLVPLADPPQHPDIVYEYYSGHGQPPDPTYGSGGFPSHYDAGTDTVFGDDTGAGASYRDAAVTFTPPTGTGFVMTGISVYWFVNQVRSRAQHIDDTQVYVDGTLLCQGYAADGAEAINGVLSSGAISQVVNTNIAVDIYAACNPGDGSIAEITRIVISGHEAG